MGSQPIAGSFLILDQKNSLTNLIGQVKLLPFYCLSELLVMGIPGKKRSGQHRQANDQ